MIASRMFIVTIMTCVIQVFAAPTNTDDSAFNLMPDVPNLIEISKKLTKILAGGAPMKLTADVFADAQQIEMIDLSYGEMREIESRAFYGPSKLKKLNLSGNKLTSLPRDLFPPRNSIKTIDLSDNQIESLNRATFKNLQHVKTLDLSNNRITSLDGPIFADMINLREVDLTGNPIRSISESFFASLPQGLQFSFDEQSLDYRSGLLVEQWAQ